jgi:hypothetical protein
MQLLRVSFARLADMMIIGLLIISSTTSLQALHMANGRLGLDLQVVALLMSSYWNVQDVTTKY